MLGYMVEPTVSFEWEAAYLYWNMQPLYARFENVCPMCERQDFHAFTLEYNYQKTWNVYFV
jgi:hypothetical protein